MHVLLTGAGGFVGRPLLHRLRASGHRVTALLRRPVPGLAASETLTLHSAVDLLRPQVSHFEGVDAVLHLAARTHAAAQATDAMLPFVRDNVAVSEAVFSAAQCAGVSRFVLVSSAKVYGETSPIEGDGQPHRFSEDDFPFPADAYGASKFAAELLLGELADSHNMALSIVRPPLVIGAGVKGNLATLKRVIELGLPLPLASIANQRSLVSLGRLLWLLEELATSAEVRPGCWNVADLEFSTPGLLRELAAANGRRARLFRFPPALLARALRALRRPGMVDRLLGSLVLDVTRFERDFPRCPPTDAQAVLAAVWQDEAVHSE
jgi:nucleoside-diphosphate-sugar epimerase